jgi:cyclophilin family peptidyl-prolyl cis-trans isomerase
MKYAFAFFVLTLLGCAGETKNICTIETEFGTMKVRLFDSTPKHRDNFIKLVKEGYYNDLLFHRVINGFMIQGGDPDSRNAPPDQPLGTGGPGYTIPAEIGSPHFKGMLAAARLGDAANPARESSGSQFFIVQGEMQTDDMLDQMQQMKNFTYNPAQREKYKKVGGTPMLDAEYTVFGEVISGLEVIDKIANVQTNEMNRPLQDIKMKISLD